MLMESNYQDIKETIRFTPEELKGKTKLDFSYYLEIGYYAPSNANWSYIIAVVDYDGYLIKVVTRFGAII